MVEDMPIILGAARDPRDFTVRHDLGEMLFLALCGILCGEKICVEIADFASAHEAKFREVLSLRHGTPTTPSREPCGFSIRAPWSRP